MNTLITPLGEIDILIDGKKITYLAKEGRKTDKQFPDLLARYQIEIEFIPDGNTHYLSCVINGLKEKNRDTENGELIECQNFYSKERIKLSIGVLGEQWGYINGKLSTHYNDYDIEYLENGMTYVIMEETKTSSYKFGIAWIDNVGWDDTITEEYQKREVQTWFGADPTISL